VNTAEKIFLIGMIAGGFLGAFMTMLSLYGGDVNVSRS
jgi:hypothetical protein